MGPSDCGEFAFPANVPTMFSCDRSGTITLPVLESSANRAAFSWKAAVSFDGKAAIVATPPKQGGPTD